MAKVEMVRSLYDEIDRRFKGESVKILKHLKSLEQSPKKGKVVGVVGGIVVKELKYRGFRFYFITEGSRLKVFDASALVDILLRFVRMSDKKKQKQTIAEIRSILIEIGTEGF